MEDIKTKTINNVFEFSRKSIGVFEEFKWHKDRYGNTDTYKGHSSQALMLDVFGLMKNTKSKNKLVNSLFNLREENWDITFEYDNKDILNEIAPTQVDVMLSSKNYLICIECKFTENDGGSCSQIKRLDSGIKQCNGNYQLQINERFGTENKCALTGKGIKYWDYIDELYTRYSSEKEYMPCPFKSGSYQWMRNVCFNYALGKRLKKKSCFYISYYDDEHLTFARKIKKGLIETINKDIADQYWINCVSYNKIIETGINLCDDLGEKEMWMKLKRWVEEKVRKYLEYTT